MNAQEMFKKIKYKLHTNRKDHIVYRNFEKDVWVSIFPLAQTYSIHSSYVLPKKLHLAIHQQMIELGWLE
jgi:hypothetical protein